MVTNRWPGKKDLAEVSDRVITAEPTVDDLARAIGDAAALAESVAGTPFEPADTPYFAPWAQNLEPVVDRLARRFGDV